MKIGIIVYSQTGHTLSVAEKIKERLAAGGHEAEIEKVTNEAAPDVSGYDILLFGSPVQAFNLAQPMKKYMSGLPSLEGKKVSLFVTHNKFAAKRAIKQMTGLCKGKGASVLETGIVQWPEPSRESQIEDVAARLSKV